jgi:hypothetical protein
MSFYEKNKNKIKEGMFGEEYVRSLFIKDRIPFFQADTIFKIEDTWCLGEIKYQEIFEPGNNFSHYGHGLPKWQVDARLSLYEDTGIHPFLFIVEKSNKKYAHKTLFYNSLVAIERICLPNCEGTIYYDTQGKKKRRVYNVKNFFVYEGEDLEEKIKRILKEVED